MRVVPATRRPLITASAALVTVLTLAAVPFPLEASAAATTCDAPVVAVLDTGIETDHPEFANVEIVGWNDFVRGWGTPYDDHGHGTATAGLVAGVETGVNTEAKLMVGKVLDRYGSGSFYTIAKGIDWAVDPNRDGDPSDGADVISMSLGTLGPYPGILTAASPALDRARAAGVTVVTSAGNSYAVPSETASPSSHPDILSVGATDADGNPSTYSNLDPEVAAWGTDVEVAALHGGYRSWSGTSFAAPQVAGWAAGVQKVACESGVARADQPERVEHALKATAEDTWRPYAEEGHGVVTPATAVDAEECVRTGGGCDTSLYNDVPNDVSDLVRYAWG